MTEFGFIEQIKQRFNTLPTNNFEGIGDDCAVLEIGQSKALVFTSDMLIERIHFLRDAISPYELGRKSLSVNLSDIAAMGARPTATLLSLSIPRELTEGWIEEFMRGYHSLSQECGVALIGGDTTSSKGDLSINVTAIGEAATKNIKRRSSAKVGDRIFVTGELGGSGAGLQDTLQGRLDTPNAKLHRNPTARISEGVWLGEQEAVRAMMDISDGVASDLRHILKASHVGAEISTDEVPYDHQSVTLEQALCSGEDYELLLTIAAEHADSVAQRYLEEFGKAIYPIGKIVAGCSIEWLSNNKPSTSDFRGFTHY